MDNVIELTPEKIITTIKNKKTGEVYETEEALKVANIPEEDVQRDVTVIMPALDLTGKTIQTNRTMGIEDIQISEELQTNAPSIRYRGDEGPRSPQQEKMMMLIQKLMSQGMGQEEAMQMAQQMMAQAEQQQTPRQMAAYGGIMGVDGRKKYGFGSWFQENVMDPIKVKVRNLPPEYDENGNLKKASDYDEIKKASQARVNSEPTNYENPFDTFFKGTPTDPNNPDSPRTGGQAKNIIPVVGGALAGLFTKGTDPENPGQPDDNTALALDDLKKSANILTQEEGMAAGLNFLLDEDDRKFSTAQMFDTYANAANGGRIGFNMGGGADMDAPQMNAAQAKEIMAAEIMQKLQSPNVNDQDRAILQEQLRSLISQPQMPMMAQGGRIGMEEGGIMDLGGMEKDYRAEGGFVPIGKKEKADDVPARLSVNEFVFTADAVRNAGGGDIDQGAQVMENMMKHLEQGGQVSEESQGMQGARDMFATSERLSEVI